MGNSEIEELKEELKKKEEELRKKEEVINDLYKSINLGELKLRALTRIAECLDTQLPYSDLLDKVMEIIMQLFSVEAGSLLELDESKRELIFRSAKGPKGEEVKKYRISMRGRPAIATTVVKERKSKIIPNVWEEPHWDKTISEEVGFKVRNILCAPLKAKERILGVVELINKRETEFFSPTDEELLNLICYHIALVIENYKIHQLHLSKERELNTLIRVNSVVNSTLQLDNLLNLVVESVASALEAEASSLLLYDKTAETLEFKAIYGTKAEFIVGKKLKLKEGIAGYVADTKEEVVVNDVSIDKRFSKRIDTEVDFVTRSILALPLILDDELIGVLEIINKKEGDFSDADLKLAKALCDSIVIALHNSQLYSRINNLFKSTIEALATAIDAKHPYTHGHSRKVAEYSSIIGEEMYLSERELERLNLAALLHDIGKIAIPDEILDKPGKLSDKEFEKIKIHPDVGVKIVEHIEELRDILPFIKYHHERLDGKGYHGLSYQNIPLLARIITLADAFDAMTSERPYQPKKTLEEAINEIKSKGGTQFDPVVVAAFLQAVSKDRISIL